MNRMKRLTGRKILLATVALCAFGIAKAQNAQAAKDTLTLTLDKALTIALDENPTMKVAAEEIALKKVAGKEAWQSLLPEASIAGSLDHTIKAAEMKLNDMSFKMGQDGTNTANAGLSINLPLFAPAVYRTMSMTKTDIELAVEKSRASKLDLVNQVSKAYYQLMLAQDSYDVLLGSYKLVIVGRHCSYIGISLGTHCTIITVRAIVIQYAPIELEENLIGGFLLFTIHIVSITVTIDDFGNFNASKLQ